jgi:hypothetical protein
MFEMLLRRKAVSSMLLSGSRTSSGQLEYQTCVS